MDESEILEEEEEGRGEICAPIQQSYQKHKLYLVDNLVNKTLTCRKKMHHKSPMAAPHQIGPVGLSLHMRLVDQTQPLSKGCTLYSGGGWAWHVKVAAV